MIKKDILVQFLDEYFSIEKYGPDPAMSRMVPSVYNEADLKNYFTEYFLKFYNGLMISGAEEVSNVFGAVFPSREVLAEFIDKAVPGDLLFLHHPIDMECGDPQGKSGRAFLPIDKDQLDKIKENNLSIYSCHHPLDCHNEVSTNLAIAQKINLINPVPCLELAGGFVGLSGEISPLSVDKFADKLKEIFSLPYLDQEGKDKIIKKVVIVAGSGDKVDFFKQAEALGADAYVSGEIHCHIDNEKGRTKMKEALGYMENSQMSFFGVSHAASEFLVIKDQVLPLIAAKFDLPIKDIPLSNWWH